MEQLLRFATPEQRALFSQGTKKPAPADIGAAFRAKIAGAQGVQEEIQMVQDPYEVELREKIAQEKGYDFLGAFVDGVAVVRRGGRSDPKYGFVDRNGEE